MPLTIAIVGRPNVGKSTLFNRLAERRRALVHPTPGVTRDRIEGAARIGHLEFTAIDTAGLTEGPEGRPVALRRFEGRDGKALRVVATWAPDMGGVVTAALATELIKTYRPGCLAMCGICAGRRGKVSLGDVIFADRLYTYCCVSVESMGTPEAGLGTDAA